MSDNDKPTRLPACVNCARRKTKCDRNSPCSSCVTAKAYCRYVQKPPEKKQRIHSSKRYEESLTYISNQLDDLSNTLHSLVVKNDASSQPPSSHRSADFSHSNFHVIAEPLHGEEDPAVHDQQGEDENSSFYSRSKATPENSNLAGSSASENETDTQNTAVSIVQALIQDATATNTPSYKEDPSQSYSCNFSQYPELKDLCLPPMDAVLRLLTFVKSSRQRFFVQFPHADEDEFAQLCQNLYFPTQAFTVFAWISVNGGLFYLFRDLDKSHYNKLQLTRSQVSDFVAICSRNLDRSVKSLRLCVSPSLEAIDALVCAASVNLDAARGSMGWKLVSAAARMTIDLGYHHLPPGYGDRLRSRKRKLFWYVYSMDKSLAFNFGRSPTIQDYDVSTARPTPSEDFRSQWGISLFKYIDFAQVMFNIYEQLFTARAQQEPLQVRVRRVHEFAEQISFVKANFATNMSQEDEIFRGTVAGAHHSIDIGFFSILTLIYRVLPADDLSAGHGTISDEANPFRFHTLCVENGRAALRSLVSAWDEVAKESNEDAAKIFISWTSLFIPFMPYIAVFGNQMVTGNQEDLMLLRKVVGIVGVVTEANDAVVKLYRAFARLLRTAETSTSANNVKAQRKPPTVSTTLNTRFKSNPHVPISTNETTLDEPKPDVNMIAANGSSDFTLSDWQDLDMAHQDWDMMFNEFDLGLGAESARDMMPWFEQHMSDFNTSG